MDLIVIRDGVPGFNYQGESPEVMREKITALTRHILSLPEAQTSGFDNEHLFCDGMYVRKMRIKAGTVMIGKIHRLPCINFVESGDITVLTESGCARIKAGFNVISPAGLQKVGIAHEDTVFINIFRTDETDIDKLENIIACESFGALEASCQ